MTIHHQITIPAIITGGPSGTMMAPTSAMTVLLSPSEAFAYLLTLLTQVGHTFASGDGDALYSPNSLVFTNMAFNDSSGAPNFYQLSANGLSTALIAGSICNHGAWVLWNPLPGTPDEDKVWWLLHNGQMKGDIGTSDSVWTFNLWAFGHAPDMTSASATRIPRGQIIDGVEDMHLVVGAVKSGETDIYVHPTTGVGYRSAAYLTAARWSFAFSDDPNDAVWWFTYWPTGGVAAAYAGDTLYASDLVKVVPEGDSSRVVVVGAADSSYSFTQICFDSYYYTSGTVFDVASGGQRQRTSYGANALTHCNSMLPTAGGVPLVPQFNARSTTGLGQNTLLSLEEPVPFEWMTSNYSDLSRGGGKKGQSSLFWWCTDGSKAQLTKDSIDGVDVMLLSQLWVRFNNGAVPGINGAALTL